MPSWNNDPLILYHGCSDQSLRSAGASGLSVGVLPHNISLAACGLRTEFGRGFYGTTWLDQAKSWGSRQAKRIAARSGATIPTPKAVVLRFEVARNDLADLQSLVFTNEESNFWQFVAYCRAGHPPHGRLAAHQQEYDVIYGPVSIWPQQFVIKDCDQVSFHTAAALSAISALTIVATGNPFF